MKRSVVRLSVRPIIRPPHAAAAGLLLLARWVIAKFHYTDTDRTRPDKVRAHCRVRAKFHYTDPTGPARTRTDFFAAKLRWVRAGPVGPV